jgi:NAD(P)-dependent dehydrogenase (short-subunit alcohol dehydrogenase family)
MDMAKPSVAVVTGASAGVGRAVVRELARRGFDVALLARGSAGLDEARAEVVRSGRRALALPVDVADAGAVSDAAAGIERQLGPIAVWINNAVASVFSEFESMTPEEFERVTHVTYLGVVHGTRAALARMRFRDRGTIVQVGSALAYRSMPLQSAHCGAKAAIRGFTDSVRCELRHRRSGIRLTMVQLPALNTPQFDWGRAHLPHRPRPVPPVFQPEVAARAIVGATLRRPPREIVVGWPTLKAIVLGAKLFPGVGDWWLAKTGYGTQQASEAQDPDAPDNLFAPVPGDFGAHGRFDARAKSKAFEVLPSRIL